MNQLILIPEATDRKPILLIITAPVDIDIVVTQETDPGTARNVLRRTPPATTVSNVAEERTIEVTATARKTTEATGIRAIG